MPGVRNKTRRTIAPVGAVALKDARQTAREWLEQITEGSDPKAVTRAREAQESATEGRGFVRVVEDYIAERLPGQRKGAEVARDLRREFGGLVDGKPSGPWAAKRVDEIEPSDVADVIRTVAKRAPHQARNVLGYVSRVFDWAVSTGKIKYSPCASIKPKALLGEKEARRRTLDNSELNKLWHGAASLGYPFEEVYRLLILTGLRLNEVADASWSEFDIEKRLWTIPAGRMKAELAHVVPLCDCMVEIIQAIPKWRLGKFLFSATSGAKPVYVSNKVKLRLNEIVGFGDWVNHDIRRTVRTNLSRLAIEEHVRELMLAHTRKGIAGVYDRHSYLDEKRAGFELWCARVQEIVSEPPS